MKDKNTNVAKVLDFLHTIENLKSTIRAIETQTGRQESSAEHSWRLAVMVMVVSKEINLDIDAGRAIKMALIHDVVEAIVGDTNHVDIEKNIVSKDDKRKLEFEAINVLYKKLPQDAGDEVFELWNEYEDCVTVEANFVKALDKLETLTQLAETGYTFYGNDAKYIPCYADKYVSEIPELIPLLRLVKSELKEEFKKGDIEWKEDYDKI
jgi:putative hydrolases of HD superfamily